jgi:hypothetical protein
VSAFISHEERMLVLRAEDYAKLADRLPPDIQVVGETERFLRNEKLLTLQRRVPQLTNRSDPAERR